MHLRMTVAALLFLFLCFECRNILGHSILAEPVSRVDIIADPRISISSDSPYSKRFTDLRHTDSFTLSFLAFNTTITLHLSPNTEIFHPSATIRIFDTDGEADFVETLDPRDFRVYKGYVVNDHLPPQSTAHTWARIIIRHDLEYENASAGKVVLDIQLYACRHDIPIFEGAFLLDNDIYHIKTISNFQLSKRNDDPLPPLPVSNNAASFLSSTPSPMVIYRDSDIRKRRDPEPDTNDFICAMEEMVYNQKMTGVRNQNATTFSKRSLSSLHMEKRSNPLQGCPTARKIAYMGVVADCTYVQAYGSIRYARLQIINDWNMASAVYERTFNVSLGLIYIQMSSAECPRHPKSQTSWNQACSNYYTINDRLSDFSMWRGKRGDDGAALWHLMTKCSTGVKVGIAWLSQLCETQVSQQIEENGSSEWVSGAGVSSITREEWKVVAHEIGHGFGAIHDCTAQTCPCSSIGCSCCPLSDTVCNAGQTYLMNPTSNVTTEDFSPCSISDICGSFPNIGYCLQSPDASNTKSSMCGNGILEPGEECDSGLNDSACCNARTCKLKPGAVCDDYSQQCCINCTMASSGTVCRPAVSECDIPEYCTGKSFNCPSDVYEPNGSSCANDTMKCASGVCTSRDEQCIARGLRLGVTESCPFQQDTCQVTCEDPSDPGNCLVLSGMFLDGTECGLAGYCEKGVCISTGAFNTINAWVDQHKQIAIPVFLFGSLIILSALAGILWFLLKRYRKNRLAAAKDKDSRPSSIVNSYSMDDLSPRENGMGGDLRRHVTINDT